MKKNNATLFLIHLTIIFCLLSVLGCQSGLAPRRAVVNLGVVENETKLPITKLKIVHLPTNVTVEPGYLPPSQKVTMNFKPRELLADKAIITWQQNGQDYKAKLKVPKPMVSDGFGVMKLVYRLHLKGKATAHLVSNDNKKSGW